MFATEGKWQTRVHALDWHDAVAPSLGGSIGLLGLSAIFLLARRLSGALVEPLPLLPLLLTAAVLAAWLYAIRSWFGDRRLGVVAAVVMVLFAIGCSAGSGRVADWLVWSAGFATTILVPVRSNRLAQGPDKSPELTLQQLTRTRSAEGVETIRGALIAEFAPHERLSVLYVAFCPPLERIPKVQCEVVAGPLCEVKVAQIFHQGVRMEARLLRASTAAVQVKIGFVVSELPPIAI